MSLSKRSRERIALVVFLALIAFALWGAYSYITMSRTWNVAASSIDDATGQMDGYTVIVYKGTVEPQITDKGSNTDTSKTDELPIGEPKTDDLKADESKTEDSALEGSEAEESKTEGLEAAENNDNELSEGILDATQHDEDVISDVAPTDTEDAVQLENEGNVQDGGDAATSSKGAVAPTPIDIEDIKQEYLDKNATVVELNIEDIDVYADGIIIMKGGHRFGVFSIDPFMTSAMINKHVKYFEDHAVDFVVALTPDTVFAKNAKGIDILISTKDEGLFVMGQTVNDTFSVNAPQVGSVGVVLISPSNVVSAKAVNPSS